MLLLYVIAMAFVAILVIIGALWSTESKLYRDFVDALKSGVREFLTLLKKPTMNTWNSISPQEP